MPRAASQRSLSVVDTRRDDVIEVLGPHRVADPYRWLEDAGDPDTVTWLAAQRELYQRARDRWRERPGFRRRLAELTAFEECSAPIWRGPRAFYTCRGPDDEHPSLRMRSPDDPDDPDGPGGERVILDPVRLDASGQTTLDAWVPSRDGRLVACLLSTGGTEQASLRVLDAGSGAFVGSVVDGCRGTAVAWLPGQDAFFYVGGADRPCVRLHSVTAASGADSEVFGTGLAETSELDLVLDSAGQRLLVTVVTDVSATTEIWLVEQPERGAAAQPGYRIAACPDGWSAVWPGNDGRLYLLTDHDAPRGQIVVVDAAAARTDPGRTLVPEDPAATIESMAILDGGELARPLVLVARGQDGHTRLSCHDLLTGSAVRDIALPGTGTVTELTCRQEGGHEAWFSYTDPLTPPTVYRYDARSRSVALWRVPGLAAIPGQVRAEELRYRSADGTPVRLLVTRPAGASGPLPTILHVYGAFGEPQQAEYYELGLAWAEAGGMLAIPCVRGGGEEGESWHEAGMLANKQRGIDDVIAAAEHLIAAGLADPEAIGVKGFSAGGLLAGAAFVQRPRLFAAAECTSPLLDMARYELTGLGRHWSGEFGRREDPEELGWMLGYSPYHNVTDGTAYPAVLLATFDGDTRVDPMHARKMCAALQHASSSGRPVLLRTEPGVGHGARSRTALLGYFADVLGFFAHELMEPQASAAESGRGQATGRGGVPA